MPKDSTNLDLIVLISSDQELPTREKKPYSVWNYMVSSTLEPRNKNTEASQKWFNRGEIKEKIESLTSSCIGPGIGNKLSKKVYIPYERLGLL